MAAYTGQEVTWEFVRNKSKLDIFPKKLEFGSLACADIAMPGKTTLL
jgi:hypothetical protein